MQRTKLNLAEAKRISVALETNGKGFIGFIVQLPGAFVRGKTEDEALSKVVREVSSYAKWLGVEARVDCEIHVSQRHLCSLTVEDADSEILLDEDKSPLDDQELKDLCDLATYSGETFHALFSNARLKDWVDESKIRRTFYGETPKTVRETFDHVNRTQYYYLSRANLKTKERISDFLQARRDCLGCLHQLLDKKQNSQIFRLDDEDWTLRKIMRRFVWHDRIHGKAIARIMEKQKTLGLLADFRDPFYFST